MQMAQEARVRMVAHFGAADGDITPALTSLDGLEAGVDQLVAERWAWLQPVFRRVVNNSTATSYSVQMGVQSHDCPA